MTTSPAAPQQAKDYLFDTGSALGAEHLAALERQLDPATLQHLPSDVHGSGWRCLDLGSGAGSIATWLARRVGPRGEVHAVDLDTSRLDPDSGVRIHRHDVREGLGVPGPFDLIHARLLLVHLPDRERIFDELVDALAPGGLVVLGDVSARPLTVVAAPDQDSIDLWQRIQRLSHEVVSPRVGMDFGWGHRVAPRMIDAGLTEVTATETAHLDTGGELGCLLHANLNRQAEPALLAAGATPAELADYRALVANPRFRVWSYQFVCASGRRS